MVEDTFFQRYELRLGTILPKFSKDNRVVDRVASKFSGQCLHVFVRVFLAVGPATLLVFRQFAMNDEGYPIWLAQEKEGKFVVRDNLHVVVA